MISKRLGLPARFARFLLIALILGAVASLLLLSTSQPARGDPETDATPTPTAIVRDFKLNKSLDAPDPIIDPATLTEHPDIGCPECYGPTISVDRGDGSTYYIGERARVCYTVPRADYMRILNFGPNGTQVILQGRDDGRGGCFYATLGAPPGMRRLRIEMLYNGSPTGEYGETYFYVIGGPVRVDITVDRENGAYMVGETIRLRYTVSRPVWVRLYDCPPGQGCHGILEGNDDGRGGAMTATASAPLGWEKVRIEAVENGQVLASDEAWFYITRPVNTEPPAGMCRVTWIGTNTSCSGEFGLASPQRRAIFSNYQSAPSQRAKDIGPYDPGTSLTFYIRPTGYCANNEYLSTSANARIQQLGTNNWRINWEDLPPNATDSDYNDLIVDVQCGLPVPQPDPKVSRSLTFSPNPANVNDQVTGSFSIHNYGNATWNASQVCIAGVPNGGGPPCDPNVSIAPGQTLDFQQRQSFSSPGTYNFEVNWQDSAQNWHRVDADSGVSRTGAVTVNQPACGPGAAGNSIDALGTVGGLGGYVRAGTNDGSQGATLSNARITLTGPSNQTTTTNAAGIYSFNNVPIGAYQIKVEHDNYSSFTSSISIAPACMMQNFTLCASGRWLGQYYGNRDLTGQPSFERCDANIDFYWGRSGPKDGFNTDDFSVRWTQDVNFSESGTYRFRTFTDDGLRLYLDGTMIINDYNPRGYLEKSTTNDNLSGVHQIKMEYVQWANDALAHFGFYRCPNGKQQDCSSDITPQYQNTGPWEGEQLGTCDPQTRTIGSHGCALTSVAMALQRFNIATNPSDLNRWLRDHDGYVNGCDISWAAVEKYAKERSNNQVSLIYEPGSGTDNDHIRNLLRQGLPVILHVTSTNTSGHYVLATDVARELQPAASVLDTFGLNDPWKYWFPSVRNKLNHVITLGHEYNNTYLEYGYYRQRPEPNSPSLQFTARGTDLLVTDSHGRRSGYDPATQQILLEIPDSSYFDSTIAAPSAQLQTTQLSRTLYIKKNAGGSYNATAVGLQLHLPQKMMSGDYSIGIVGFDSNYAGNSSTITGSTQGGGSQTYNVTYNPGQSLQIDAPPTTTSTPTATSTPTPTVTPTRTPTPSPTSRPIATVFIQPANALVPVNTWTTMDVRVANAANLQSANVRLTFDPAIFQVEDADIFRAGLQVSAGDCFPAGSTVGPTVQADNGAGTITFAATRGGAAFTGTCTIASIRFRAVRGGLSPLAFSVAPVLRDPTQAALSVQSSNALMTVPRPYLRYFPFVEQARSAGFVGSP